MLFSLLATVLISGCNGHVSPNLQLSALRSAGDVSVTAILDNSSDKALPDRRKEFEKYLNAVNELVTADSAEALVQATLRDNLEKIQKKLGIPEYLTPLIDDAIDSLARKDVPVGEKLGPLNVARLAEFVWGARQGVARYRPDFREKEEEEEKPEEPAPTPEPEPEPAPPSA